MTSDICIIDPDATPAENVGAVLAYREAADAGDAFERAQAAKAAERHRARILRGNPPFAVLHAVERGTAPAWVVEALRDRFATVAA